MIPDVHLRSPADHLITSSSPAQEQRFHIWLPVRLKTPPTLPIQQLTTLANIL